MRPARRPCLPPSFHQPGKFGPLFFGQHSIDFLMQCLACCPGLIAAPCSAPVGHSSPPTPASIDCICSRWASINRPIVEACSATQLELFGQPVQALMVISPGLRGNADGQHAGAECGQSDQLDAAC